MTCCSTCAQHACACGCGHAAGTPLPLYNRPGLTSLGYRVGTWADFQATMQTALRAAGLPALDKLRTRDVDDPAIALLDAWAVGADVLTFYQERIANEGFLRTATERQSVLELARLVDYRPRPGVAASVYLAYTIEQNSPPVTLPAGARAQSVPAPGEQMQTFETAEPLDARCEWNALKPRLTQPQDITPDNVAALDTVWIASAATNLKANDRLLFVFGYGAAAQTAVRLVASVAADPEHGRSAVALQATATPTATPATSQPMAATAAPTHDAPAVVATDKRVSPIERLVDALRLPPTLQPESGTRLVRDPATALGAASDTRPQLLLNFAPRIAGNFYRAWTNARRGQPSPRLSGVYALRVSAALFGYNAPDSIVVTQTPDDHGSTSTVTRSELPVEEQPNIVRLDNGYDGVVAGSWLVIQPPGAPPTVARVKHAQVHPESSYGIHGKTTELALDDPSAKGDAVVWPVPEMATLRRTQVYGQSERLDLAELPLTEDVGAAAGSEGPRDRGDDATHLTLEGAVDGLKSGRWVIVAGQRSDVPGTDAVNAAELVMLAGVEQNVDASLPGDTVHSTLVFANAGLAYRYRRDTVTINANVVRATHGETRNEVLGSADGAATLQAFTLKQSPLTWVSAPTVDGMQSTLAVRVNGVEWHEIGNLSFAGGADRSFVTSTRDTGKTTVQFGDGAHGARLPTGVENVTATYRNGIGTPGNVAAQQVSLVATKPLGVKAVINPLRAAGGADPETRDQARRNVPLAVLALDRLVSVSDYADFARTFGGVGKAVAIKLGNRVQVTIAGAGDAPIDPTSDLYRNLLQALRRYGDPGLQVGLAPRELLALTLSANIGLAPDCAWDNVEPAVRAALLQAFGFEQRALAQGVHISEVIARVQAVRGVTWVDVDALGSVDETTVLTGLGDSVGAGNTKSIPTPATYVPALSALPPRYATDGKTLLGAQLLYLLPAVPDTLLLREATP